MVGRFDELFEEYRSRLYRVCFAVTGNSADTEDALQEAFVDIYRGLTSFRGQSAPYTWLYRVALRASIRVRSRQRRHDATGPRSTKAGDPSVDPRIGLEVQRSLEQGLQRLTAEQRSLLSLCASGLSQEEIANVLGIPVGTVWSRIHAARRRLADAMGK
jgi:RNA polymerase sigma-70 factor (ECF subfamily)